jgi:PAS domain S-box-containing protein
MRTAETGTSWLNNTETNETERWRSAKTDEELRQILNASPDGIIVHDGDRILDINLRAAVIFGCYSAEIVWSHVSDWVAPESQPDLLQFLNSGSASPLQLSGLRKLGRLFPLELEHKTTLVYHRRRVQLTVMRDLSFKPLPSKIAKGRS